MQVLYDKTFPQGQIGHNASYMQIVDAYQRKKDIDQQAFNGLALYQAARQSESASGDQSLTPALDFYKEYLWSSRGGVQEIKHTYSTSLGEVYLISNTSGNSNNNTLDVKVTSAYTTFIEQRWQWIDTSQQVLRYNYNSSSSNSFDITASVDGIETDTQMRYSALASSRKVVEVMDPSSGGILYSAYTDPNGLTINVPTNANISVYTDVNQNPIQFYDVKQYHSLQADYIASLDGCVEISNAY